MFMLLFMRKPCCIFIAALFTIAMIIAVLTNAALFIAILTVAALFIAALTITALFISVLLYCVSLLQRIAISCNCMILYDIVSRYYMIL